jgi:hypothetical protein
MTFVCLTHDDLALKNSHSLIISSAHCHLIQLRNSSLFPTNESAAASTVSEKGGESVTDAVDFPMALDDDDHQVIMDDDDSDVARRRSLRLSEPNSEGNDNYHGISFDASTDDHAPEETAIRRPPRKRRKIVIDDGRTELSNDHIRAMLADTSDICRGSDDDEMLYPAARIGRPTSGMWGAAENERILRNRRLLWSSLNPPERLFCRPSLSDDGYLSAELLELWARNCGPILSQPFLYDLVADEENEEVGNKVEEEQEIEETRHERDVSNHQDESEDNPFPQSDDAGFDPSFDNDRNNGIPFDDEDERFPTEDDAIPFDSTFFCFAFAPSFRFSLIHQHSLLFSFVRSGRTKSAIN